MSFNDTQNPPKVERKLAAYAFFGLLGTFKVLSGLAINYDKSEGMWIGTSRKNKMKPLGIKWPYEPIKALGVYYTYDLTLLHEKKFIENIDKVKKLLNLWSCRVYPYTARSQS